jgi:signal peptidase II
MKKREWLIVFLPLVAVWYIDRITKSWAMGLVDVQSFGFIHFALHHNPGAMLGLFADLPPVLRIVSLSTGGAFLVVIYSLIQYLLPIKSLPLRSGMSILLGGILGNVTDRILWGHVVDFIILGTPGMSTPAFNLADALQWVGYGMIAYIITRYGETLWPEKNARKGFWINPKFQLKYCYLLLGVGLSLSLVALVFSYTYMKVVIADIVGNNPVIMEKFLTPFIYTFLVISLGFGVGLFAVGKVISHKIAGPVYAFEKYVGELISAHSTGKQVRKFHLRTNDEFKELEPLAHSLKENFAPNVPEN